MTAPIPTSMQALVNTAENGLVLRELPAPTPGAGQVLVRARAVSVNNADTLPAGNDESSPAGYEFAGEVAAVGPDVTTSVGSRVMGTSPGSFPQYVLVDHRHVMPVPDGLDWATAAALPTGLLTEHGALALSGSVVGRSVLVTGASSSMGLIGVQIARALGASRVVGTVRSPGKAQLVHDAGADTVVVTDVEDLTAAVLATSDGAGVDVVLDHVGGSTSAACLPATAVDGTVVNIGRLDSAASTIDLDEVSYRHLTVRGVSFGFTRAAELGTVISALSDHVLPAVADGRVRPVIDSTLAFADANQAVERLRSGVALGKVVLTAP